MQYSPAVTEPFVCYRHFLQRVAGQLKGNVDETFHRRVLRIQVPNRKFVEYWRHAYLAPRDILDYLIDRDLQTSELEMLGPIQVGRPNACGFSRLDSSRSLKEYLV